MRELMRDAHRELPTIRNGAFRYSEAWFEAFIERIVNHGNLRLRQFEDIDQVFLRRPRAYQRSSTTNAQVEVAANYIQTGTNLLKIKLGT